MKDKIIVSDYFEEEQGLNSSAFDQPSQESNNTLSTQQQQTSEAPPPPTNTEDSFTTSQRLSHILGDSNNCFGLGYMPLNSTSDVGFNKYPVYCNNLLFNIDSDSYCSEDPLIFNSQQLIIPEEHLLKDLSSFQTKPKMERLESCVSEISTSSSDRTQEIESSPCIEIPQVPRQSLFDMCYSTFSSDTESFQGKSNNTFERAPPRMSNQMMMKNSARINHLPSLETLRKQVSCELNIYSRRLDQMEMYDRPSMNIIMAGCSSSGKSQLKSLLSSVMEFESERILPNSESYPKLVFRPLFRNLDHGSKTYQVTQDESEISFYKWDENITRCSVMFQPMDSEVSDQVVSQRILFTDMPGISSPEECPKYCKLLSQLYVGMYVSEMDNKMIEYGFENIKSGGRIQQLMCHDIVLLTIPIEFTESELKITKALQQHMDEKSIPYLVVATKTDLVENERKVSEKKKEIARFLGMRSFDILTIGMSGKSKEGIEDFELIRNDLHKEIMLILRQLLLQYNKKRSFVDNFKMRHGGLSQIEYSIKIMTMNIFHYWMILHKIIHWIVIGPGGVGDSNLEVNDEEEQEKLHLDNSTNYKKSILMANETTTENMEIPHSTYSKEEKKEDEDLICKQLVLPSPPLPKEGFFMRGPSHFFTLPPQSKSEEQEQETTKEIQQIRDVQQSEEAQAESLSESDLESNCCDEESMSYHTKPNQAIVQDEEVVQAATCDEGIDGEESPGIYLCSMRIFQCLVVSLLFVLVFQSFALFAVQNLSSI